MALGIILGLTGPTGSGKSTVSEMLGGWGGIRMIDCDKVSRQVTDKGRDCVMDLAMEFSPVIINTDGTLNRRKLGSIVFSDAEKLKRLNEITHPYIVAEMIRQTAEALAGGARCVVLDAPTLFESGAYRLCDKIVAVVSSEAVRRRRIVQRDSLSFEEAAKRIKSQQPEKYYTSRADFVIFNNGDMVELRLGVLELQNFLKL